MTSEEKLKAMNASLWRRVDVQELSIEDLKKQVKYYREQISLLERERRDESRKVR